jgi:hypothetical protein
MPVYFARRAQQRCSKWNLLFSTAHSGKTVYVFVNDFENAPNRSTLFIELKQQLANFLKVNGKAAFGLTAVSELA